MADRIRHEPNMSALYAVIGSYKDMAEFYADRLNIKGEAEIRKRINYVIKHKLKQMNEVEALKWVLGELTCEENINETKDIA